MAKPPSVPSVEPRMALRMLSLKHAEAQAALVALAGQDPASRSRPRVRRK